MDLKCAAYKQVNARNVADILCLRTKDQFAIARLSFNSPSAVEKSTKPSAVFSAMRLTGDIATDVARSRNTRSSMPRFQPVTCSARVRMEIVAARINALPAPQLKAEEQLAQPGTQDLLRVLNRKTTCVAIGLLGAVFFAALVLPFQERHSKIDELTKEESKITGDFVPHVNPAAITDVPSSNEKRTHEIVSEKATSSDSGLTLVTNELDVKPNANSCRKASGKVSARVIHEKYRHVRLRSSVRLGYIDVKPRLIALWHQSLQREKSPGWTLSSNSNKWQKKKISYTAAARH